MNLSFPLILFLVFFSLSQMKAQSLADQVEIVRDTFGVPHVFGETDAAVAYGLAWAHAEDDFATIQLTLLSGKQMLGKHLGKAGAPIDYVVGLLRCRDLVDREIGSLSAAYLSVIKGYTAGMNSYALHHPKEVLLKGSFPITVEEVLTAYVLSLAVISGADAVIQDLFAGRVPDAPDMDGKGSNAFAVSRKRTTNGKTFLNVNSHQPLEGPVSWYEAHLVSDEGWNALGGLFPGAATIFHGTNEYLGWAHTVNYPDKVDVFELEINPNNENQYRLDGEWLDLEVREIPLKVKLFLGIKFGVKREAYWSKHGPVVKNDKGAYAFNLGALNDLRGPDQWYRMNKARDWLEFKQALEMVAIPGFNIVYADREDNIFYVSNAKTPFRNPSYDWSTTLPGNTSATISEGYHPLEDLPQTLNPNSGYVFNTNNSAFSNTALPENPDPADHDPTMGYLVFENNRSTRFRSLIDSYDKLSYEDFKTIKYDQQLPLDTMVYPMDFSVIWTMNPSDYPEIAGILSILQSWDRRASIDNVGAAHFTLFYDYLKGKLESQHESLYQTISKELCIESLLNAQTHLITHFGKLKVTLGEFQRHTRGDVDLPISGIRDVIATMTSKPTDNGRVRAYQGESYIMLAQYDEAGVQLETINAYGASAKPDSPHYTDQMRMFVDQQLKPMTLNKELVYKYAESIYRPK